MHFVEYALLCAPLVAGASRPGSDAGARRSWPSLISSLYAASDELHQAFVEGRHGTPARLGDRHRRAPARRLPLRLRTAQARGAA